MTICENRIIKLQNLMKVHSVMKQREFVFWFLLNFDNKI